jgi:hypothetical protein
MKISIKRLPLFYVKHNYLSINVLQDPVQQRLISAIESWSQPASLFHKDISLHLTIPNTSLQAVRLTRGLLSYKLAWLLTRQMLGKSSEIEVISSAFIDFQKEKQQYELRVEVTGKGLVVAQAMFRYEIAAEQVISHHILLTYPTFQQTQICM